MTKKKCCWSKINEYTPPPLQIKFLAKSRFGDFREEPHPVAALGEYGTFWDLQLNRSRQEEPPLLDSDNTLDKRDTFFCFLSFELGSNGSRNSLPQSRPHCGQARHILYSSDFFFPLILGQIFLTILRLNVVDSIVVPDSIVAKFDFFCDRSYLTLASLTANTFVQELLHHAFPRNQYSVGFSFLRAQSYKTRQQGRVERSLCWCSV